MKVEQKMVSTKPQKIMEERSWGEKKKKKKILFLLYNENNKNMQSVKGF